MHLSPYQAKKTLTANKPPAGTAVMTGRSQEVATGCRGVVKKPNKVISGALM
jgi:hypothetical protein